MSRHLLGCACAAALAMTASVAAQNPPAQPPPTQDPPRQAPAARPGGQDEVRVTVEGCVMREEDVPGRKPNVAERAGIGEDYILTSAKIVKGSAPSSGQAGGTPTGTSGVTSASMFHIEGIDDEKLKSHVGRRVQIEGTLERSAGAATGGTSGDLPELRATTIRPASGECPPNK